MYNLFGFVLSAATVGTGRPFLSEDCSKSVFLELLCMLCEAFKGVQILWCKLLISLTVTVKSPVRGLTFLVDKPYLICCHSLAIYAT